MSANFFRKIVPMCCSLMLALAACGGSSSSLSPDADLGVLSPIEESMQGKLFNNQLIVYTNDDEGVAAISKGATLKTNNLLNLVNSYSGTSIKSFAYPNEDMQSLTQSKLVSLKALEKERNAIYQRVSGDELKSWDNVFEIRTKNAHDAVLIYRELKSNPSVRKVYPKYKSIPMGMMEDVPPLQPYQSYLHDTDVSELGILTAKARFNAGSPAVWVVDHELGIDFFHPNLQLSYDAVSDGGNDYKFDSCAVQGIEVEHADLARWAAEACPFEASHGTATAGVLIGKAGNDRGIEGILPSGTRFLFVSPTTVVQTVSELRSLVNGAAEFGQPDLLPGSIFVIEYATFANLTPAEQAECAAHPQNGCVGSLPAEAYDDVYDAIEEAKLKGITVISGAGNGSVDLGDPSHYPEDQEELKAGTAASILVGASVGRTLEKADFSNCGPQVQLFSWGSDVMTTNYTERFLQVNPDDLELYRAAYWDPTVVPETIVPALNPTPQQAVLLDQYYATNFSGTSSATAIVAGVAGLMQNYVKAPRDQRPQRNSVYLMQNAIQDILWNSGSSQTDNGCRIGRQPNAVDALDGVDQLLRDIGARYPHFASREPLTLEELRAIRNLGVGLICETKVAMPPTADQPGLIITPDPSCSEEAIHPTGSKIAKDLDFDGDNRADLVKWTRNGGWKVDLSNVGGGEFAFGAWDLTVRNPAGLGQWVSPYAIDLDSDGRTDFVLYDRENNVWNVLHTRWDILQGAQGQWEEIQYDTNDWVDDRKLDWKHSNYSRPVPGDYNGDGWVDIAIACSDGIWRIDYSDEGEFDGDFVDENERVTFLDESKLEASPGWAWLPVADMWSVTYRVPDTLEEAGKVKFMNTGGEVRDLEPFSFVGNSDIISSGDFGDASSFGFKESNGAWSAVSAISANGGLVQNINSFEVNNIFGGSECHPTAADFDGDSFTDRAVLCPDGWTVAYSAQQGDEYISRRYTGNGMGYDADEFTVPGRVYFGGISYAKSVQLINFALQANPRQAPPIPVDMVTPFVGGD